VQWAILHVQHSNSCFTNTEISDNFGFFVGFSVFSVFQIPTSVLVSVFQNIRYRFGFSVYRPMTSVHCSYVWIAIVYWFIVYRRRASFSISVLLGLAAGTGSIHRQKDIISAYIFHQSTIPRACLCKKILCELVKETFRADDHCRTTCWLQSTHKQTWTCSYTVHCRPTIHTGKREGFYGVPFTTLPAEITYLHTNCLRVVAHSNC